MCGRVCFFFFKQKTAYEMRISDWSSDVCSSDLRLAQRDPAVVVPATGRRVRGAAGMAAVPAPTGAGGRRAGRGGRGSAVAVAGLDDLALVGAGLAAGGGGWRGRRSEEHTSELQSLMRISYAVFCLKKKRVTGNS